MTRCAWSGTDPLMIEYHDTEWGVPVHDDRTLFEYLILEGAQAGLSWKTILHKREAYRTAFDNFDIATVAHYTPDDIERLLNNPGIVRNRLKIASAIKNAHAVLGIQKEYGSFDTYLWNFVHHTPIQRTARGAPPVSSPESDALSADLKKRGCTFVGTTICYAFMQAVGMVNDHDPQCFRTGI